MQKIKVIGGGLAGCECAYQLAKRGFMVELYEMKPQKFSPAHTNSNLAELVCSNSLKSNDILNACGLLKQELREMDSLVIRSADINRVPAGNSLSVDRENFSAYITSEIKQNKNIKVINEVVNDINIDEYTVIATGPLTDSALADNLGKLIGEKLYFFDAAAPIISKSSLDSNKYFIGNRYDKSVYNEDGGDYINCPLTKEEYDVFYKELINAKIVELKEFENSKVFEGCMPVEVMAKRGYKTLLFSCLKPVGLTDNNGKSYYAVLQLRKESLSNDLYNMVGFQTNLLFNEQKRVFSLIPALKNAEFLKYGVMHKNIYINAPNNITEFYQLKKYPKIFIAGQLSGVEGYVESTASGMLSAIYLSQILKNKNVEPISNQTSIGALGYYITHTSNKNFQPMNSNYGIINKGNLSKEEIAENSIKLVKEFMKDKI